MKETFSNPLPSFLSSFLPFFPVACCLLPVACCLLPVACCLLPVACCLVSQKRSRAAWTSEK
ncbi:MAG: hypothetical protein F6K31_12865 [Symploca sp. SIO2G7]|nr:hypothetical protein [Symploca sp. SIO2G7]